MAFALSRVAVNAASILMLHHLEKCKIKRRRKSCGGDLQGLSGSKRVNITGSFFCEWSITGDRFENSSTVVVTITGNVSLSSPYPDCQLAPSKVVVLSSEKVSFCSKTEPNKPFVVEVPFIPSNPLVRAVRSLEKQNESVPIDFTFSWKITNCGGSIQHTEITTLTSPNFPRNYPSNMDCVWVVEFPYDTPINIHFESLNLDMTGSSGCTSDYVAVHSGASKTDPQIGLFCGSITPKDVIIHMSKVWIHFHSDKSLEARGFNITLTESGGTECGGLYHAETGQIDFLHSNQYVDNLECTWEIRVEKGFHIKLEFIDRFYIEESTACANDFIEIFDYIEENSWKSLARVCGRTTPSDFNSTSNRMKIMFRTNERITGDGFKGFHLVVNVQAETCTVTSHVLHAEFNVLNGNEHNFEINKLFWEAKCGQIIRTSKEGYINSPRYPANYGGPLNCNYTVVADPSSRERVLEASFVSFDLGACEPPTCGGLTSRGYFGRAVSIPDCGDSDRVEVITNTLREQKKHLGSFCGSTVPPEFQSIGSFTILFVTDGLATSSKGFSLKFSLNGCGGEVTEEGPISLHQNKVIPFLTCLWNITAPPNMNVALRISQMNLITSGKCFMESVQIYDGKEIVGNGTNLVGTVCGLLNVRQGVFRSKGRSMLVKIKTLGFMKNRKFQATVKFSYDESTGCGGSVQINEGENKIISSPDLNKDGKYEPMMDCVWTLIAPSQKSVFLIFNKMDLSNCTNAANQSCSCDYIEIYDGPSENNEVIGKYCGSGLPGAVTSSRGFITIKFVSDEDTQGTGFRISASSVTRQCGDTYLSVDETPKVLTSPNYPDNYPKNVHCQWILMNPKMKTFDIHFQEINIEPSDNCTLDRLEIADIGIGLMFTGSISDGLGQDKLYIGNDKLQTMKTSLYMGSRYPFTKSIFCGMGQPLDFYSSSNRVQIRFFSDSSPLRGQGFKLTYTVASCSRNYTSVQGRIRKARITDDCTLTITAPNPNATISLYFMDFSLPNCQKTSLKIYDGPAKKEMSTMCGTVTPNPLYSTGPVLTLKFTSGNIPSTFDITYTTTTDGQGCGGTLFNYGGLFSSPFFPNNVRKATRCWWLVSVPVGNIIVVDFPSFDMGTNEICETDFMRVYDVTEDGSKKIRATYCGQDRPAEFVGTGNQMAVLSVTSMNNGGNGWSARFMAKSSGPAWPALTGSHLFT